MAFQDQIGWIYNKNKALAENYFQFSMKEFLRTMIFTRGSIDIHEQIHLNCIFIESLFLKWSYMAQPAWEQIPPMG